MPTPGRADAIRILRDGQLRLDSLIAGLSVEEIERTQTLGGGDWGVNDLIGHVASWEEIALDAIGEWREGKKPWIEKDVFGTPGAVDRLNEQRVNERRAQRPDAVRASAQRTHQALLVEIEAMDDAEWNSPAPYSTDHPASLGNVLGGITAAPDGPCRHAFAHLPDLEAYVASLR